MEHLWSTLEFFAKATIILIAAMIFFGSLISALRRERSESGRIRVRRMNERLATLKDHMLEGVMPRKAYKQYMKRARKEQKRVTPAERSVFVLDFKGDILANAVGNLRREITAVLSIAGAKDEVVVRLESPGGAVTGYGLAASQLQRVRDKGIKLTVCVDKMAASGGYMMAAVADHIVAAPFAIVGSIGVMAPVPNFNRLLRKHNIDYEDATAGQYKRTISILGEITETGRRKFQEQLEDTHLLFKDFVKSHRPEIDVERVATGEHWFAARAVDFKLVHELATSDDYLLRQLETANLLHVTYKPPESLRDRLVGGAGMLAENVAVRLMTRVAAMRLG